MDFKDYYATLGLTRTATHDEIRQAYRKLARKYHPDVSKEPDAEARFKEVAEAHEALVDAERRAAYDDVAHRRASGQASAHDAGTGHARGFEFSGRGDDGPQGGSDEEFSEFFASVFGRAGGGGRARQHGAGAMPAPGRDHHAKVVIDLQAAYAGAQRTISLRMPVIDAQGQVTFQERQLEVNIPKGVRAGQHLRLGGQGAPGHGGAAAGDLYLEIGFEPHALFRVEGRDVYFDLPVAPWEAALGATVAAPTPEGSLQLSIPPGSSAGRKLRLKGKGLPGQPPGDLYAVLVLDWPRASSASAQEAYHALARAFPDHHPRSALEA